MVQEIPKRLKAQVEKLEKVLLHAKEAGKKIAEKKKWGLYPKK